MSHELEQAIRQILTHLGECPTRDGLIETPKRVIKALREMTEGYSQSPAEILSKRFAVTCDEMVVLKDISFYSLCEHHMLPFRGKAHIAYLPTTEVVGISKLARLVHCYAKRLQVQERLTSQIATSIQEHLLTLGVGVVVEAHHLCMGCRGVKQTDSIMVTSSMLGAFREPAPRDEFLRLIGK